MNVKTIVQIILLIIILVIFYIFYHIYFKKDKPEVNQTNQEQNITSISDVDPENDSSNIFQDIEYKSSDRKGNQYILKAESGEIDVNDKNIMKLQNVIGKIILVEKTPIDIFSNYAEYNTVNYDTKFYEEVEILFEDNKVDSDNFDLFIKDNFAKIYNNVKFNNNISKIDADIINIDLLKENISVDMFNESNKVNILKK